MYRDKLVDNGSDAPSRSSPSLGKGHTSPKPHKPTPSSKDGGLLGPILGGLLQGLGLLIDLQFGVSMPYPTPTTSQSDFQPPPITTTPSTHTFNNPQPVPTATSTVVNTVLSSRSLSKEQVGFVGIFFR
jgi:hypothetical protein